jgi:hypothetical protein
MVPLSQISEGTMHVVWVHRRTILYLNGTIRWRWIGWWKVQCHHLINMWHLLRRSLDRFIRSCCLCWLFELLCWSTARDGLFKRGTTLFCRLEVLDDFCFDVPISSRQCLKACERYGLWLLLDRPTRWIRLSVWFLDHPRVSAGPSAMRGT